MFALFCIELDVIYIFFLLWVTLDLVKSAYAKFIEWDEKMFDQETNTPAYAAK